MSDVHNSRKNRPRKTRAQLVEELVSLERLVEELQDAAAERESVDHALRESEARLRAIMDHAPAAIFLIDTDCRYVLVNREFERRYNVTEEEVKGKTIYDFFPEEFADEFSAQDREVLKTREAMVKEQQLSYAGGLHTDLEVKFPILDSAGAIVGVGAIATDITERKRAEESLAAATRELRASEQKFRTLVSNLPCAIYRSVFDGEWEDVFMSEAMEEITGYPATDFIANRVRSFMSIVHPDDRAMHDENVEAALTEGRPFELEYRVIHADGSIRWIYDKGQWVFGDDGEPRCFDGVIFDITERKAAEERVRQHEAELAHVLRRHTLGEMAASLAHELNQPLTAIATYSDVCLRKERSGKWESGERMTTLKQIHEQAVRAGRSCVGCDISFKGPGPPPRRRASTASCARPSTSWRPSCGQTRSS